MFFHFSGMRVAEMERCAPMLTTLVDHTRQTLLASLAEPDLGPVAAALESRGHAAACDQLTAIVTTENDARTSLADIRDDVAAHLRHEVDGLFERVVILRQAARAMDRIETLPVSDDVKRLFCEEFQNVATPPRRAKFDLRRSSFVALCELATIRRFPAGQFHWTTAGLRRSWLLKARGRDRLRLVYWVATRLRGFKPAFVPHLNPNRRNRWLTENLANKSYYCMARSLEHQPEVKGLIAASWLRSRDTFKVSPELEWMNRTIVENGGMAVVVGPADPNCGVLTRSAARQRAYDSGVFKPTIGLVVWPRDAMLAWAERHPELRLG
jgi:RNase P subunit RPR2